MSWQKSARFFVLGLLLSGCSPKETPGSRALRVLTYSSMVGEGSLGELIQKVYSDACLKTDAKLNCSLDLIPEDGASSLVASFVKTRSFDAVLGLDEWQSIEARAHRKTQEALLFAKSPHAIIVNLKTWPKNLALPKTWKDLASHKNMLLIQDPRVSVVGLGWIKAIYVHQLISSDAAKSLVHKSFPSWSLSYSAFSKGLSPLIWSYQTSEAYHICSSDGADQFKILQLEEGYPQQEEWALVAESADAHLAKLFKETLLSQEVQNKIAEKNYMLPSLEGAFVPECFSKMSFVKPLKDPSPQHHQSLSQKWRDQWSL